MAKKNSSVLWTVQQSLDKTDKELARKNIGFDTFQTPKSDSGNALKFVTDIVEDENGDLKYNTKNVKVSTTYNSTSEEPASGKSVKAAIDTLNSSSTLTGGNYYTGMSETAGIVTLTQAAMDTSPTKNSTKPVTSGGVYNATKSLSDSITTINTTISNMDYTDSAVANQFVTSVSEANGVISVTRAQVTPPGAGALQFKFGSASAVSTGFNANSDTNVTYTFPNADNSAYGVTKLYKYGSTAPTDWNSFSTLDDTAATPKSVAQYFSANDTKNTVGTGTHSDNVGNDEHFYVPYTLSDSGDYQQSYVGFGSGTLFEIDKDINSYCSAKVDGRTLAQYRNPTGAVGQIANQVIVADGDDHEMVTPLTTTIGSEINPVYIDRGILTACYPLTSHYSREDRTKHPYNGILLTKDDTNHEYAIDSKDYGTYYQYHAATAASGNDPAVPEHFTDVQVGGFLFGDGFGSTPARTGGGSGSGKPAEYWGVDDVPNHYNNSPAIIEAPSILYAMTTLLDTSSSSCSEEIWNKHRIYDYDTCSLCRNATRSTSTSASYVSSTTLGGDVSYPCAAAIAYVPPKHWAFISGVIQEDLNGITQAFNTSGQTYYFHLSDTITPSTTYGLSNSLHVFDVLVDGVNNGVSARKHNFSFFAYNPSASNGKYIVLTCATRLAGKDAHDADAVLSYKVYKQIMIFKTPEYGGFDYVYDNYPVGWKPSVS